MFLDKVQGYRSFGFRTMPAPKKSIIRWDSRQASIMAFKIHLCYISNSFEELEQLEPGNVRRSGIRALNCGPTLRQKAQLPPYECIVLRSLMQAQGTFMVKQQASRSLAERAVHADLSKDAQTKRMASRSRPRVVFPQIPSYHARRVACCQAMLNVQKHTHEAPFIKSNPVEQLWKTIRFQDFTGPRKVLR